MTINDAHELFSLHPNIKVVGYEVTLNLSGDLYCSNKHGKMIRVIRGTVVKCRNKPKVKTAWKNSKVWYEFDVKEFELICGNLGGGLGVPKAEKTKPSGFTRKIKMNYSIFADVPNGKRRCGKCGEIYLSEEFRKNGLGSGYYCYCKDCNKFMKVYT